ncbi:MAG: hypothetical protein AAB546_00650 [Patescibacteria group bacterium]
METHFKFRKGLQREFLLSIAVKSCLSVTELAQIVNVHPRTYRDWKAEKNCISGSAAKILSKKFDLMITENEKVLIERWRKAKSDAGKTGVYICIEKHGNPGTLEGRRKGGTNSLIVMRKSGIIPGAKTFTTPNYSEELAEIVGILLGDGGITNNQAIISLNAKKDKQYVKYVCRLVDTVFNTKTRIHQRRDNTTCIYITGTNFVKYLLKIGLKIGNKVRQQVEVPSWVKSNREFQIACLKGLMDTDGCAVCVRRKKRSFGPNYLLLSFCNYSRPLLSFVFDVMQDLGLRPSLKLENGYVWVYNKAGFYKYFDTVGTNNPRNLNWRRQIAANST